MQHLIVGDVHLTRLGSTDAARDLAALVADHRGDTVVFVGDLLDLAIESVHGDACRGIGAIVRSNEPLRRAVADHVGAGGDLVLVAGNHDDAIATTSGVAAFADALGLDSADRTRIRATPWFARLGVGGAIHVEHGHHYDPDNALPHPLAPPDPAWRSLGIALMHRFVAPMGAGALVHANDGTPMQVLVRAFELYGRRAPNFIASYLIAAARQVYSSGGRYPGDEARALGDAAVESFALAWGVTPRLVRDIVGAGLEPTMESLRATFLRLYWDRALAAAVGAVAGTSALLGGPGRRVAIGAAAVLVASIVLGRNRYRGRVSEAMVEKADWLGATTGARAVVFGHIHVPTGDGIYRNTGSFAFPGDAPGRPYVSIDDSDCVPRRGFYRAA